MRPNLPRGQAPAKGILHTEQRTPRRAVLGADGKVKEIVNDPRGYWLGQHEASGEKTQRRLIVARFGRRQYLKQIKAFRRAV